MTAPGKAINGQAPSEAPKTYGFIGLGVMGYGMAKNLRDKLPPSDTILVCEIAASRRDQWISENGLNVQAAETPLEIALKSDVIITMLPRGEHVYKVFTDPSTGLLAGSGLGLQDKLFIECSTIDVETSLRVAKAVKNSKLGVFSDAPVSGGVGGANAGTLTFMVGAPSVEVFNRVKPVISLMGNPENIFHCGDNGAGLASKQINNYMSAVNMIAVCEGLNMGRLQGLDLKVLSDIINTSTGMSRNSREQNPVKGISPTASSAKDFEGGFSTELCSGVVDMAVGLGEQLGARTILASATRDFYNDAKESEKCKGKDFRSIFSVFTES